MLKTGSRWRDLPDWFTSASACWKRVVEREMDGILNGLWLAFLETLDEHGTLKWTEAALDAMFSQKERVTMSAPPSGT